MLASGRFHAETVLTKLSGGKLYGTTEYGGNSSIAGVVFEITTDGQERTIHIFGTRDQDYAAFPCCLLPFKGNYRCHS